MATVRNKAWKRNSYSETKHLQRGGDLDGRGVGHEAHLLPHKYVKNTSTRGMIHTENLLNPCKRPLDADRAGKTPYNRVGQKKKGSGTGPVPLPLGGSWERRKVPAP